MKRHSECKKSLLAQIFDALWSDPQMQQDLFKLVADLAEEIVTVEYIVDWIVLMVAEKLPASEEQLRKLNVAPLIHFVEAYIGKEDEALPAVKAQVVQVTLNAQAFVKGALTLEIPAGLSQTEIEQRALERTGDAAWVFNGTIDGTEQW